jgi:hypothetical protein
MLLATPLTSFSDTDLPNIPPHRHFIQTPNGDLVQVGPRVCDDPSLQAAFNQFHSNVHRAVPGSQGPAQSVPGLHNGVGADITLEPCSFVP